MKHRITTKGLSNAQRLRYFSSLALQFVHAATQLENGNNVKQLQKITGWDLSVVESRLRELDDMGLVSFRDDGSCRVVEPFVHIDREEPEFKIFQQLWRAAISARIHESDKMSPQDFHFTALLICDHSTFAGLKENILKLIENLAADLETAPNEAIHYLGVDLIPWRNSSSR